MSSLPLLLDQVGVGRPLPDGSTWTRAAFARAIGYTPSDLSPFRARTRRQEDLRLALRWALIAPEREPDGWEEHDGIRDLTCSILLARRRVRGEGDLEELAARLVTWGDCPSDVSAAVVAEQLVTTEGARLRAALARGGWEAVRAFVRGWLHA